ncbi:MAG: aminotransferase class V-fold PLP-dependent enzyme [Spirochaetota bacterium]
MRNTYFDNAATSFPAAPGVAAGITRYIEVLGGPYGRSSYKRAVAVSQMIEQCRDSLALLLKAPNADSMVFTHNATHALNMVISGLDLAGKTVLVSTMEHNAVMRPLACLEKTAGVTVKALPSYRDGRIDAKRVVQAVTADTALAVVCHMSNVNGLVQPLDEIREALGDIPLLVDAAQSAGHTTIDIEGWGIDFLAVTGHKGLLGPTGTGALYIAPEWNLSPFIRGGTGSNSESYEMPDFLPDALEAGTPNIAGIIGFLAALNAERVRGHTRDDFLGLMDECRSIPGLRVIGAANRNEQGELFSIIYENDDQSSFAAMLYNRFGIETRVGLHCAPAAHIHLGTAPSGSIRISPSIYHTPDDFAYCADALRQCAGGR